MSGTKLRVRGCSTTNHYLACLRQIGFDGSLILHSLEEEQVAASAAFVRERMNT